MVLSLYHFIEQPLTPSHNPAILAGQKFVPHFFEHISRPLLMGT